MKRFGDWSGRRSPSSQFIDRSVNRNFRVLLFASSVCDPQTEPSPAPPPRFPYLVKMGVEGESPGSPPGPANAKASFSAKGGNLKDRATDTVTMKVTRVDKEMAVSKQRDVSNLSSASAPPQANRPRPQGVRISREGVVKRNHSPTSPGTDDAPPAMKRQNSVGTPSWKTADAGCQTDFIIDYVKPIPSTGNDWKRVIEPSLESAFKNTKDLRESLVSVGSFTEVCAWGVCVCVMATGVVVAGGVGV